MLELINIQVNPFTPIINSCLISLTSPLDFDGSVLYGLAFFNTFPCPITRINAWVQDRKIIKKFRKRGVCSSGLKHQDLKAKEGNNRIFVSFGSITVDMVDEFVGVILGVLIGVPVFAGGIIQTSAINGSGNGDSKAV
ncbi:MULTISPECIES: hypothetical protein [Candidatus Kuenenia]|nr:hypothetical protein [Candidatus Kuenenia stuttgartiensis]MBE7546582.1 hypothetical protein [Planctomycetia bacterium]MCF6151273.1 hypothetical protein [Candidatus Kuenenia stuttgartiensis]MCL4726172.1 hypothetical protein [Candidatus Kuenenia stuttgartiensis]